MKPSFAAIRELLAEHGEMTRAEIQDFWPTEHKMAVSCKVTQMHKRCATKQIYVARWVRKAEGQQDLIRAVFALGDRKDAPKPGRISKKEQWRRRRAKLRALRQTIATTPNSIFALAQMAANDERRAA